MGIRGLFLASAAVLACGSIAQAADLPVADPGYVRVCDAFGTGYYYIPGTETCLKIGGYARVEAHYVDGEVDQFYTVPASWVNNWTTRTRGQFNLDARTQSEFGLIRTYVAFQMQIGHQNITPPFGAPINGIDSTYDTNPSLSSAFIEITRNFGTFTAGRRGSFFDFWAPHGYGTRLNVDDSTIDVTLFGVTFDGPNGLSFTIAAEDPASPDGKGRRRNGDDDYEGQELPDAVANIRYDGTWGSFQVMGALRHIHDAADLIFPGLGPPFLDPGGDGLGFAVGAGWSVGLPGKWALEGQVGYADGAVAYVTDDPGNLGDISGLDGDDTNEAWSVRAGIIGPLFNPNLSVWLDGSFTSAEADDGDSYDAWAIKTGARWEPVSGLYMGPEVAFQAMDMDDVGNPGISEELPDYNVWGVMWRIQRSF